MFYRHFCAHDRLNGNEAKSKMKHPSDPTHYQQEDGGALRQVKNRMLKWSLINWFGSNGCIV